MRDDKSTHTHSGLEVFFVSSSFHFQKTPINHDFGQKIMKHEIIQEWDENGRQPKKNKEQKNPKYEH